MAIFDAGGDAFNFEPLLFSGGKERVTVNGVRGYEGILNSNESVEFSAGGKTYQIAKRKRGYKIRASDGDRVLYEGVFAPEENAMEQHTPMIFLCGGGCFLLVGLVLFGVATFGYLKATSSTDWPTTAARITKSAIDQSTTRVKYQGVKAYFTPVIRYEYSVDGRVYVSDRFTTSFPEGSTNKSWANEMIARYPVGATISAHYNPDDHKYAVLETGLSSENTFSIVLSIFLILFGLVLLVVGKILRKREAEEEEEGNDFGHVPGS